ncbi:MAG: glycosyltransferase family 4 protein [Ruminococcaceae bacterium]|nr:glycosyltransferase family 4 protein [Oscillospiraceae bacterium]
MKIALNAMTMSETKAGVGNYAWHVIRELQQNPGEHQFTVYVNETVKHLFSDSEQMKFVAPGSFSSSKKRLLFELTKLGKILNREGYDFLHFLDYATPLQALNAPFFVTVHDVSFFASADYFTKSMSMTKKSLLPLSCKRAVGVITVSEFTKRELLRYVKLSEDKIHPVLLGTEPPRTDGEGGEPCVLCVGTVEPRKDQITAIKAMELLWKEHPEFTLPLVIAGKAGWRYEPIFQYAERSPFCDRIHFTGYCTEKQLAGWYRGAKVFLFPSLYEGFGLPPLEAMSYGVPVVASNAASLPEVLGNGAILCPIGEEKAFAKGILDALGNDTLIASGRKRAAELSWKKTAAELLAQYQRIAERSRT